METVNSFNKNNEKQIKNSNFLFTGLLISGVINTILLIIYIVLLILYAEFLDAVMIAVMILLVLISFASCIGSYSSLSFLNSYERFIKCKGIILMAIITNFISILFIFMLLRYLSGVSYLLFNIIFAVLILANVFVLIGFCSATKKEQEVVPIKEEPVYKKPVKQVSSEDEELGKKLIKLFEMKKAGILSEAEFAELKKQLITSQFLK